MVSPEWHARVTERDLTETHKHIAACIGIQATLKLCEAFGGTALHIPLNQKVYRAAVVAPDVYKRYMQGEKITALARVYGLSEATITRYIRAGGEKAMEAAKHD